MRIPRWYVQGTCTIPFTGLLSYCQSRHWTKPKFQLHIQVLPGLESGLACLLPSWRPDIELCLPGHTCSLLPDFQWLMLRILNHFNRLRWITANPNHSIRLQKLRVLYFLVVNTYWMLGSTLPLMNYTSRIHTTPQYCHWNSVMMNRSLFTWNYLRLTTALWGT